MCEFDMVIQVEKIEVLKFFWLHNMHISIVYLHGNQKSIPKKQFMILILLQSEFSNELIRTRNFLRILRHAHILCHSSFDSANFGFWLINLNEVNSFANLFNFLMSSKALTLCYYLFGAHNHSDLVNLIVYLLIFLSSFI